MEVDAGQRPVDRPALVEAAARLVDLRGVASPPTFSGRPEDWSEFRFRFDSVGSLLGLEALLYKAAHTQEGELEDEQLSSRFLYNLL
eukprot:5073164-Heterocapsa_arctica.AAC.1